MKKILFLILASVFVLENAWAGTIEDAQVAYKTKRYDLAITLFQKAMTEQPSPDTMFSLGLAQARAGQYEKAKTTFDELLKQVPSDSELARKARKNIGIVTKAQVSSTSGNSSHNTKVLAGSVQSGDNYLAHALTNGKIIHFDVNKMPLRVFIADAHNVPGWDPTMKTLVKQAMNEWQSATGGRVRFVATQDMERSDIIVRWARSLPHNMLGVSPYQSAGDIIVRSDVTIGLHNPVTGTPISRDKLRATAIHEMGHALGVKGHSPFSQDIMYYADNQVQSGMLTARDRKTMGMLYKLDADVSNSLGISTVKSKEYIVLMDQAVTLCQQKKYAEALPLFKKAQALHDKDPVLFFNLGMAQQFSGDVHAAIVSYRRTIALDSKQYLAKYNLAGLLYNQSLDYARNNQSTLARQSMSEAADLFEDVTRSPGAPSGTSQHLQTARQILQQMP